MDALAFYLSPWGLALSLVWDFAAVSAVQLTVRLIHAYSVRQTALAAVIMTVATPVATAVYVAASGLTYDIALAAHLSEVARHAYGLQNRLLWLPLPMAFMGLLGFVVATRVLHFKRLRGALVAALGLGVLTIPWAALVIV